MLLGTACARRPRCAFRHCGAWAAWCLARAPVAAPIRRSAAAFWALTRSALQFRRVAQAKSGAVYKGVFAGATLDAKNFGVTLRCVTVTAPGAAADAPAERAQSSVTIGAKDFAHLVVKNAALSQVALGAGGDGDGFATDAAIGARKAGRAGRELVAWQPDEGDTGPVLGGLMEGGPARGGGGAGRGGGGGGRGGGSNGAGWDQFAANSAFGVVSTFDENMYTTRLDMSKIGITEAEATRLAREIEGQSSRNLHAAEERGQHVGADDDDEEARFSSVLRGGEGGGGAAAADASNDDTFGDHVPSTLDGFAKAPAPAAPAAAEAPKKSTALNPNAKPFSFNPTAKSFVPGSAAAAASAAGTAAGGAAAAAAAAAMSAAAVAGGAYGYPPGGPRSPMGGAGGWPRGAPYMGMPGGMPMAQMGPGGFPMGMMMPGMMPAMGMGYVPAGPQGWRGPGAGMMMMPGMPMPPMQPASPVPPQQQQQPPAAHSSPPQSSEARGA